MNREEAIDKLQDLWNEVYNEDSDGYDYAVAIDMAIEALSADSVVPYEEYRKLLYSRYPDELVRCKDCKHRYMDGEVTHYYWCRLHDRPADDTDYCSWGEESEVEE